MGVTPERTLHPNSREFCEGMKPDLTGGRFKDVRKEKGPVEDRVSVEKGSKEKETLGGRQLS